jgi:hypothetical protein
MLKVYQQVRGQWSDPASHPPVRWSALLVRALDGDECEWGGARFAEDRFEQQVKLNFVCKAHAPVKSAVTAASAAGAQCTRM